MPFTPFHTVVPEIGQRETRAISMYPNAGEDLPPDDYGFVEMFCDEPDCDCRRVFFYVMTRGRGEVKAVVAYGWEPIAFYANWCNYGGLDEAVELKGPTLNSLSPQSELAPAILDLVRNVLLKDPTYVERLITHYHLFRAKIDCVRIRKSWKTRKKK